MDKYEILQIIGKGRHGQIYKVQDKLSQKFFACKEINYGRMNEKEKQQLVTEVNVLRELRHPNIVRYYDRIINRPEQSLSIIMEYCSRGDLAKEIETRKLKSQYFKEKQIWSMWMNIVLSLYELNKANKNKVIHRGITPDNILIDKNFTLKLGDFGHAKVLDSDDTFSLTSMEASKYMAPEQVTHSKSSLKSDIWALGCLLYEMTCLEPPFVAQNHLSLAMKIKNAKIPKITGHYSSELTRVVNYTLQKNPKDRPSVEELLNIPQISIRLRQKRLQDNQAILNKREEELKKKEKFLLKKEEELKQEKEKINIQILELEQRKCLIQLKCETERCQYRYKQKATKKFNFRLNTSALNSFKLNTSGLNNSRFNSSLLSMESTCDQSQKQKMKMAREEYFARPKKVSLKLYPKHNVTQIEDKENINPNKTLNSSKEKPKSMTCRDKEQSDINVYKQIKQSITQRMQRNQVFMTKDNPKIRRINSLYTTLDLRKKVKKSRSKMNSVQNSFEYRFKKTNSTFDKRLKNLTLNFEKQRIKTNLQKVIQKKRRNNQKQKGKRQHYTSMDNRNKHYKSIDKSKHYLSIDRKIPKQHCITFDKRDYQNSFHYNLRARLNSLQVTNNVNRKLWKNKTLNTQRSDKIRAMSRQNSKIF